MVCARLVSGAVIDAEVDSAGSVAEARRKIARALSVYEEQLTLVRGDGRLLDGGDLALLVAEAADVDDLTVCIGPDPLEEQLPNLAGASDFAALATLTDIKILGRGLRRLPDRIRELTLLEEVSFAGNRLETLPESFGVLQSLRVACLQGNRLNKLPEAFGFLAALSTLDLMDNHLKSLPDSFCELASLQTLLLMYNPLNEFPDVLCKMSGLCELNIGHCNVSSFPDSIGCMASLSTLNAPGNLLNNLPESFCMLALLQRLDLQGNPMAEAMQDRHPARFVASFLHKYHSLKFLRLLPWQDHFIPDSIAALGESLAAYLEQGESAGDAALVMAGSPALGGLRPVPAMIHDVAILQTLAARYRTLLDMEPLPKVATVVT